MAGTYKIMIADDFPILREDLAEVIREQPDMEVVGEASTGKEIVALAESMDYDLILMDIQMPNMDGYKATQVIRRLPDREKSGIPIIAMTANAFEEDRKKALEMGMNDHIAKPIDAARIREVLSSILKA